MAATETESEPTTVELTTGEALDRAVAHRCPGGGPSFIECTTVRGQRHSAFAAGGDDPGAAPSPSADSIYEDSFAPAL